MEEKGCRGVKGENCPACMHVAMGREGHGLGGWLCGLRERRNSEQTAGHRKAERHQGKGKYGGDDY